VDGKGRLGDPMSRALCMITFARTLILLPRRPSLVLCDLPRAQSDVFSNWIWVHW
jgi:hypothetical protein